MDGQMDEGSWVNHWWPGPGPVFCKYDERIHSFISAVLLELSFNTLSSLARSGQSLGLFVSLPVAFPRTLADIGCDFTSFIGHVRMDRLLKSFRPLLGDRWAAVDSIPHLRLTASRFLSCFWETPVESISDHAHEAQQREFWQERSVPHSPAAQEFVRLAGGSWLEDADTFPTGGRLWH